MRSRRERLPTDIRFTRNKAGTIVYVMALGGRGSHAPPQWRQTAAGLRVDLSQTRPVVDYATALRVHLT